MPDQARSVGTPKTAVRKVARQLVDAQPRSQLRMTLGTVTAVNPLDLTKATVNIANSANPTSDVRVVTGYTPVVDDVVLVLHQPPGAVILGLSATPGSTPVTVPSAKVIKDSAAAIPSGSHTALAWTDALWDTDDMFDIGTQPTRLTVQTAGKWYINGGFAWISSSSDTRRIGSIWINGTEARRDERRVSVSGAATSHSPSDTFDLAVGDYIEIKGFQNSGGGSSVDVGVGADYNFPYLTATRIAP